MGQQEAAPGSFEPRWVAAVALSYIIAAQLGHLLATGPAEVSPLWPPSGVALAGLVLLGRHYWPAVFLGALVAQTLSFADWTSPASTAATGVIISTGSTLQAWLGAYLLDRMVGRPNAFLRVKDVFSFTLVAYVGSLVSPSVGVGALASIGDLPQSRVPEVWLTWWLGDAMGIMIITPMALAWRDLEPLRHSAAGYIEAAFITAAFSLAALLIFGQQPGSAYAIGFLWLPLLTWGTHRGGLRGAILIAGGTAATTLAATVGGLGPFSDVDPDHAVFALLQAQAFVGVMICTAYFFSASVAQHTVAELAANEATDRLATVLGTLPDLVVVLDESGRVVARFGEHDQEVSKDLHGVVHSLSPDSPTLKRIQVVVTAVLADRSSESLLYPTEGPHGTHTWWSARAVSLALPSGAAALWVARDVTHLRRLESDLRQKQKMEAVGQLAGGIAHDFNNLLLAINGNAEFLRRRVDGSDRDDVDEILRAGTKAAGLVKQLLDFSRRDAMEPGEVRINRAIKDLEQMIRRSLDPSTQLQLDLGTDLPPIWAEHTQVGQIVLNLVLNARDAMPHGGVIRVETSAVQDDEERTCVLLRVRDNGVGMDMATRDRIFEPFFTTKAVGKGTGLGLATVYSIVERWSGTIRVETAPDHGTTFTVRLPATPAAATQDGRPARTTG